MTSRMLWLKRIGRRLGDELRRVVLPDVCALCLAAEAPSGELCGPCAAGMQELPQPRCPGCGGALETILERCPDCLGVDRPWAHAVSVYPFRGAVRTAVHRLKYQGHVHMARALGGAMARSWTAHGTGRPDVLVPMPLHWTRAALRGYNQAGLLAEVAGKVLGVPVTRLLVRRRRTRRQTTLGVDERRRNVRHAFRTRRRAKTDGRHLLLVDDVCTTGSTLADATRALLRNGAEKVSVLTVARG